VGGFPPYPPCLKGGYGWLLPSSAFLWQWSAVINSWATCLHIEGVTPSFGDLAAPCLSRRVFIWIVWANYWINMLLGPQYFVRYIAPQARGLERRSADNGRSWYDNYPLLVITFSAARL
jgi:hypothetical protein